MALKNLLPQNVGQRLEFDPRLLIQKLVIGQRRHARSQTLRKAIEEGQHRFSASCTGYCHGREGRVSRAPKLRGKTYEPDWLYARIAQGSPGGATGLVMPAFQTMLPPEEIWKLVAYVMSLSNAKDE